MKHWMRNLAVAGALALALAPWCAVQAQDYPNKAVRIVVPYAPGGSTDILTRIVAQKMSLRLGQAVVVENRPGANGVIGTEAVAKSTADGYTILMVTNGQTISVGLYGTNLPWDLEKDFAPVANVAAMANLIVVNASQPYKTLKDLIDAAKASPGKLSYSHAGLGSPQHMAGELFKLVTRVDIVGIPYKGGGPAVADAVAGQVPMVVAGIPAVSGHMNAGRLRALAATSLKRSALLPDVPTVAESGYAGFDAIFWIGLLAPRAVPAPIVQKLNTEANAVLRDPEIEKQFSLQGASPAPGTPADFAAYIRKDIETWTKVIKEAHIKVDR